jgi:hypothetical protein
MLPDKSAFISYYQPVESCCVRMGNNLFAPILGKGSAIISVNKEQILIRDCLHVPALRKPLFSLHAHQRQYGCGFVGMHELGIFVFFPSFIVEEDMAMDCHLSYKPIGRSCTLSSLDYVQPISSVSLASTTTALPSAPAIIEDNKTDDILPTYTGHWPKQPKPPPSPSYDLSLIPPPAFTISLKDLSQDKLIKHFYTVKLGLDSMDTTQATVMPPATPGHPTPATNITPDTNMINPPSKLECMFSSEILSQLHHPNSCPPPVRPCNTPNTSKSRTTYTPEELHHLTGCRCFRNHQHIILTSKDGILINSGEFLLLLDSYATIPKTLCGKIINQLPSKYLEIVHVDIAFNNCMSIGSIELTLIFVDHATCYNWTFGLKSLQHIDIQATFLAFWNEAGLLARKLGATATKSFLAALYVLFFT